MSLTQRTDRDNEAIKSHTLRSIKMAEITAALLKERNSLKNLGIKVPQEEILKEYKQMPWWKRLFMTPKRKKLEKAKIVLYKIEELDKP